MSKRRLSQEAGDEPAAKAARLEEERFVAEVQAPPLHRQAGRPFVSSLSLSDFVVKESKSLLISKNALVSEALKEMTDRGVHWAPVSEGDRVVGMISLSQIVRYVVKLAREADRTFTSGAEVAEVFKQVLEEEKFASATVGTLMSHFDTDAKAGKLILNINTPLEHAVGLVAYGQQRFCVVEGGQFVGIYSDSDLVALLARELDKLGDIVKTSIQEAHIGLETVVRIRRTDKVVEAFRDLAHWKINGIAVLGDNDVLVGNISSSDLKALVTGSHLDFAPLYMTAEDFIRSVRTASPSRTGTVVAIREYDTIGTVLRVFATQKISRVYVVDGNGRLTGVVALRDVLRKLVPVELDPKGDTTPRHHLGGDEGDDDDE